LADAPGLRFMPDDDTGDHLDTPDEADDPPV
jgi:hypothetical protein